MATIASPNPLPSFTRSRELRSTIFKRPMPLKSRTTTTINSSSSSSSKYLSIPSTSLVTSSYKGMRRAIKIAHRQKRCIGSPDSPRIGVEDLQKFAEQYGIPLPNVCEEAVHDTFSIQIAVPKERGVVVVESERGLRA